MSALIGVPIEPDAISRRADWMPAPSIVSGAQPTRTPAARACSSRARPAATSGASGFSFHTCLPAAIAAEATSACAAGMVRFTTSCTSGCSRACSTLPDAGTP